MPLQGDRLTPVITQGVALGYELLPLQGVLGTGLSLKIACRRICMVSNSNEQYALKGQKLLAQGIALGIKAMGNAPCKGNSFILPGVLKLLPLQGALQIGITPRALPWAKSFCPFRAYCLRALPWAKSFCPFRAC